jgi:hypothetical protein
MSTDSIGNACGAVLRNEFRAGWRSRTAKSALTATNRAHRNTFRSQQWRSVWLGARASRQGSSRNTAPPCHRLFQNSPVPFANYTTHAAAQGSDLKIGVEFLTMASVVTSGEIRSRWLAQLFSTAPADRTGASWHPRPLRRCWFWPPALRVLV